MAPCFHLAFPVANIAQTKAFYGEGLGCEVGRESPSSLILGLHGHQIVAHVSRDPLEPQGSIYPRHFGLIFDREADWQALVDRAQAHGLPFYQEPRTRFPDTVLEHRTFFLEDPFHNLLEFKFYCHPEAVFGATEETQVGDAAA
ncbi:MAG: VOC family protein [Prochlorothrix sp.]|nr:VOC family protein [Prochlorothrix sp.]